MSHLISTIRMRRGVTIARSTVGLIARKVWLRKNRFAHKDIGPQRLPRVLVDVSEIIRHDAHTGIQRVVRAIWSELERKSGVDYETLPVYASKSRGYCFAPQDFLQSNAGKLGKIPVSVRPGDRFLGLDLAAHILPKHRGQLRAWRANGVSLHLVVYDLLPLQRRDWFSRAMSRHFQQWFHTLTEIADQALCISDHVASDLRNMIIGTPAAERLSIQRLRLGADIVASLPSRGQSEAVTRVLQRASDRPFILMVGTVEPRKAYDKAVAAFDYLWTNHADTAPDLVVVGRPGWKTKHLQRSLKSHRFQGQRLHWLREVSDEALGELYEGCNGLFLASYGEGFGLPVIEAALQGRHALVRDLPVFREKELSNLIYFSDDNPAPLAEKLMKLVWAPQCAAPMPGLQNWSDCTIDLLRLLGLPSWKMSSVTLAPATRVA